MRTLLAFESVCWGHRVMGVSDSMRTLLAFVCWSHGVNGM